MEYFCVIQSILQQLINSSRLFWYLYSTCYSVFFFSKPWLVTKLITEQKVSNILKFYIWRNKNKSNKFIQFIFSSHLYMVRMWLRVNIQESTKILNMAFYEIFCWIMWWMLLHVKWFVFHFTCRECEWMLKYKNILKKN